MKGSIGRTWGVEANCAQLAQIAAYKERMGAFDLVFPAMSAVIFAPVSEPG
jgi:hypothetical protein